MHDILLDLGLSDGICYHGYYSHDIWDFGQATVRHGVSIALGGGGWRTSVWEESCVALVYTSFKLPRHK